MIISVSTMQLLFVLCFFFIQIPDMDTVSHFLYIHDTYSTGLGTQNLLCSLIGVLHLSDILHSRTHLAPLASYVMTGLVLQVSIFISTVLVARFNGL